MLNKYGLQLDLLAVLHRHGLELEDLHVGAAKRRFRDPRGAAPCREIRLTVREA